MEIDLDSLLKKLCKEKKSWVREIVKSNNEEKAIMYLDEYKDLEEYKILDYLFQNKLLEKKRVHGRLYTLFVVTEKGIDSFKRYNCVE